MKADSLELKIETFRKLLHERNAGGMYTRNIVARKDEIPDKTFIRKWLEKNECRCEDWIIRAFRWDSREGDIDFWDEINDEWYMLCRKHGWGIYG